MQFATFKTNITVPYHTKTIHNNVHSYSLCVIPRTIADWHLEPDTMSHSLTIVSIGYLSDWSTNTQVLLTFIHSYRSREAQIWIQPTWAVLHDPHNKLQTNSWVIVCHANRHSLLQLLGLLADKNAFVYSLSICSTPDCTNYSLVMDTHTGFIKWIFPQFRSAR